MADLIKTKYSARSISKEEDFTNGETVEIENLQIILDNIIKSINNFIITGGEVSELASPSMNVQIAPIMAFNKLTSDIVYSGSVVGPVAVTNGGTSDRIDILEVRKKETDYDAKIRAFRDPISGVISYQSVNTKTRYELEAQVTAGTEGSGNAPTVTSGWTKLAEILVSAGETTSILDADITNASATQDGETDANWTTDKTHIYRLKGVSEIKTILRAKHEENGDHKNDVIRGNHIDWGAGAGEVDGDLMPLGTAITSSPTGGTSTNLLNSNNIRYAIQKIFDRLIDLSGVKNNGVVNRHIADDAVQNRNLSVSTAKIVNLNADLLDDRDLGNASGDVPLSNGIKNVNLNADLLDGANKSIDGTLASDSDNNIPSEKAVKTYINNSAKGKAEITLSNYDNDSAPVVKSGSVFENNGVLVEVTSDITPTGYSGISNSTNFYLYYDDSASAFIYSATVPAWSDDLQGWYNGNDRALFSMYKGSGGTLYQHKNIITNDKIRTKRYSLGSWNMYSANSINLYMSKLGLFANDWENILNVNCIIYVDTDLSPNTRPLSFAGSWVIYSDRITLYRDGPGYFSSTSYDDTTINRGYLMIRYKGDTP